MRFNSIFFTALIAILVSVIVQQNLIINYFSHSPNKVGIPIQSNRTDQGDTYHYYIDGKRTVSYLMDSVVDNNVKSKFSYLDCPLHNVYLGALILSGAVSLLCENIFSSPALAVIVSLILQASILIFAFSYSLSTITQKKFGGFSRNSQSPERSPEASKPGAGGSR